MIRQHRHRMASAMIKSDVSGLAKRVLLVVFLFLGSMPLSSTSSGPLSLGINYGMIGNNLPPPSRVVRLIQSLSVTKSRLYSTDSTVLRTFGNTGISFIVGIGNENVASLTDPENAASWVQQNISPYLPNTQIIGITVGNEVFGADNPDTLLMSQLLTAMRNLQTALSNLGLGRTIAVTTAHSLAVLSNSYPSSAGTFKPELANNYIRPMLQFLSQTGAPFMINIYPFFAYKDNPQTVSLEYALFQSNPGYTDPGSGLKYYNMFDAQVDAVYFALQSLGYSNLQLVVSETGWPSAGDANEPGATVQNAQIYNANLIQHLSSKKGTPLRPNQPIEAYIFALFNENMKPGPVSERNYGLFNPDGTRVYDFGLDDPLSSSSLFSISYSLKVGPFLTTCFICLIVALLYPLVL